MIYALSISGGKDSEALWSWAKRTNLGGSPEKRPAISCDTMWEAKFIAPDGTVVDWEAHVHAIAAAIGEPVKIIRGPRGFEERTRAHNTFPGRLNVRRWCTPELKLEPFKLEVERIREETGEPVTVVVGVRAEESAERSKMPEREYSDFYDAPMWRPLIDWTLEMVMAEHHANGLPINPLYKLGAERVGCWPCIKASKNEIRMVSDLDPARIDRIRSIEQDTGNLMFCLEKSKKGAAARKKAGLEAEPREMIPKPIDEIVAWAHTKRGGLQLAVINEPSGCARWGLCEAPTKDPAETCDE